MPPDRSSITLPATIEPSTPRIALQDAAASIAGLMITTEAGVAEAPKREAGHAEGHGGMGGMGGMM
jgi:hypothetical protein